tara:strand:- start:281 stop:556 length:276 start_codon:yes stop_codon:yes gene_type:complete
MGVLQVILNAVDLNMPVLEAISAPRFSATSDTIDVCNRIPRSVTRELEADGYEVARWPGSYEFARVHAISVGPDGLSGAADPGGDGMALTP